MYLSFYLHKYTVLAALRPVYTDDFCCGNLMQFLSRQNFKIACVNEVRFVAAISQGFRTYLKLAAT